MTIEQPRQNAVQTGSPAEHAGKIETHGIDVIPDSERGGNPRSLFSLWLAPNVNYLSFLVGGVLIAMGLEIWQALIVVVVGTLFCIVTGIVAVSGPASGTPSQVVMRTMYGVRGNRVAIAVNGWFVSVFYIALNWSAASIVGFSLVEQIGVAASMPAKIVVIVVIAGATLLISVYGQATMLRLYPLLSLILMVIFGVVTVILVSHADLGFRQPAPLHGIALWAAVLAGITLMASAPLSYTISSDFARYLPRDTNPVAVAFWTALGSFVPGVVLIAAGALGGTAVDMTDPVAGLAGILPVWLMDVFMVAVIISTISNNALTTYSSGLALQAVGVPLPRARAVLITGIVGVAMTLYALLVFDFLATVSSVLALLVVLVGPIMAVYVIDIFLRRNRYDGVVLSRSGPDSPYWYTKGVNLAGAAAILVSAVLALLCASTPAYTGPIAAAMGGLDLSLPVGMIGAAAIYFTLTRVLYGLPYAIVSEGDD